MEINKDTLELLEMLKKGVGVVRTQEQIETDLDREFQERMRKEEEQREQERQYKERLKREQEERRQQQYEAYKDIFDFMKVFNELDADDYYAVVELQNGKQYFAAPGELKRDEEYIMFYIVRNVGSISMWENPYQTILETNVDEIKGIQLKEEIKKEVVMIKKSKFGVMKE